MGQALRDATGQRQWEISGADAKTGHDVTITVEAASESEAMQTAKERNVFVASVRPVPMPTGKQARKSVLWGVIGGAVLLVLLVVGALAIMRAPQGAPPQAKAPADGAVSGGAWLNRQSGDSIVLRGLRIYLCQSELSPTEAEAAIKAMVSKAEADIQAERAGNHDSNEGKIRRATRELGIACSRKSGPLNVRDFYLELRRVQATAFERGGWRGYELGREVLWPAFLAALPITEATTGIDGKYRFAGVKPGSYSLYAMHATSASVVEWCQPVNVGEGQEVIVNFENETAHLIVSR